MTTIYEPELVPGLPPAQDTIQQKFAVFHQEHPEIYEAILDDVRKQYPASYMSMRCIVEDLRKTNLFVRVNNNFIPLYVDLVEEREPWTQGRFRKRARANLRMRKVPA